MANLLTSISMSHIADEILRAWVTADRCKGELHPIDFDFRDFSNDSAPQLLAMGHIVTV